MRYLIFKLLRLVPLGGYSRFILAVTLYLTPKKLINLIYCEVEKRRRVIQPRSFPYVALIDPANVCQLRCPYCMVGGKYDSGRKASFISTEQVEKLLNEFGEYLVMLHLYNWGEPLLNPDIAEIVKMGHGYGIWTGISTHLNVKNKNILGKLCDSGLDYMVLSIDGASQEVYSKYRRGGDLNLVLENINYLVEYRKQKQLQNPIIEWQFLVFRHNKHEIEDARNLAKKAGVDYFRIKEGECPEEEKIDIKGGSSLAKGVDNPKRRLYDTYCQSLWHFIAVNSDGGISPCCFLFKKKDDFGEPDKNSFSDIWNNERYVMARKLFNASQLNNLPDGLNHPCLKCSVVLNQKHLNEYLKSVPHAKENLNPWKYTKKSSLE